MPARARRFSSTAGALSVKYARICPSVRRKLGSRPQFIGSCAPRAKVQAPAGAWTRRGGRGGAGRGRAPPRVRAPRPGPRASRRSGPRRGRPGWRPGRRRSPPGPAGTRPRPTWPRWAAARPARPPARAGGPSRASTSAMPANGWRSSGVLRLATNGAMPNASRGATRASSSAKRPSSSMSAMVSPGSPTIMYSFSWCRPCARHSSAARSRCFSSRLALDVVAHPLAGAVGGRGQRAVAAPAQQAHDLVVQAIGAQAGDAHLAAGVDQRPQDDRQAAGGRSPPRRPGPPGARPRARAPAPAPAPPCACRRWSTGASRSRCSRGGSRAPARSGTCSTARCAACGSASAPAADRRARRRWPARSRRGCWARRSRAAGPAPRAASARSPA